MNITKSILTAKASKELQKEVEEDLKKEDPQKAKAIILSNEIQASGDITGKKDITE